MHEHIQVGDCVTLKSGCGPTMCVTKVEGPESDATVSCLWFSWDGLKQTGSFPMCVLKCGGHEEPEEEPDTAGNFTKSHVKKAKK